MKDDYYNYMDAIQAQILTEKSTSTVNFDKLLEEIYSKVESSAKNGNYSCIFHFKINDANENIFSLRNPICMTKISIGLSNTWQPTLNAKTIAKILLKQKYTVNLSDRQLTISWNDESPVN